jgi:hypothetical protein
VSLVNRVGSFFLLTGLIFLLIFAASALDEAAGYDLLALLVGAGAFGLGWHWRFARRRGGGAPQATASAAPPAAAPAQSKRPSPLGGLMRRPGKKHLPKGEQGNPASGQPAGSKPKK